MSEVREALENATSAAMPGEMRFAMTGERRRISKERLHRMIVSFLADLPDDWTIRELREELES